MKFNITDSEFTGLFAFLAAWGQVVGLWAVGVAILTVLIHIVFAIAVYRDAIRLDRTRALIIVGSGNMVYSNPHRRCNHSGYLLGDASLTPKSRCPYRLHRNNGIRRSVDIARGPCYPAK